MRLPGRRTNGYRQLSLYVLLALTPLLLVGAAFDHDRRQTEDQLLAHARAQAEVLGETVFAPVINDTRLVDGLAVADRRRLRAIVSLYFYERPLVDARVLSPSGRVLFAEDPRVASLPVDQSEVSRAAAGATQTVATAGGVAPDAIKVLTPIGTDATGAAIAVLELDLPRATVAAAVPSPSAASYWRLGSVLVAYCTLLGWLAWSSLRLVRRELAERGRQTLYDDLTGLPNRTAFRRRLEDMAWERRPMALVLIDIDRFKEVNDTLGHDCGDALLVEVARRLTHALRTDDVVARLGGDEFGLLLCGVFDPEGASELVERACREVTAEWHVDGAALTVEASFGVALFPRHALDTESLLRCADHAMSQAKRGTDPVVIFSDGRLVIPSYQLTIQAAMRKALDNCELRLHYQPQVDLRTGRIRGVEALLRWQHPSRGLLSPADFLPAVEQTGLIEPLTQWVVETALDDCAQWTRAGQNWDVAVNVSARNLDSPGFADSVVQALRRHRLPPARLRVEVTETALAIDLEAATSTLHCLSSQGIGVALDDFGVGYASLAHLRSLPLTEMKIDRGFVQYLGSSRQDQEVVHSLVGLAHGLGLRVTAEGVESALTAEWLRTSGCDDAQGFYFARPAPWTDLVTADARRPVLLHQPGAPADESLPRGLSAI